MDGLVARAPRARLGLPRRSLRAAGDERLVAQIRGGDGPAARNAFEVLFDRHHRGVLAFCRHMLGSLEEAEDAVQHTFSAAYRALLRDDREIALRAWLYAIARNRCLSMLAARREQVALHDVEEVVPSTDGLAQAVERRSDLRELLADMQRLPEDQRAALVLSELDAHTHEEIAAILDVPTAKVKALVFQARESLMIRRRARMADCAEIREQLSVLRGSALRRRELRRHVESCAGCRAFEAEVRRQRAGMAVLLPVAPTLALKHSSLAAAFAGSGAAAAGGAGAVAGGVLAGGLGAGAQAVGVKALAILAVAGGGGGYVAATELSGGDRPAVRAPAQGTRPVATTPALTPRAAPPAGAASPAVSSASERDERRGAAAATGPRARDRSPAQAAAGGQARAQAAREAAARKRAAARAAAGARKRAAAARRAAAAKRAAARREAARRRALAQRRAALERRRAQRKARTGIKTPVADSLVEDTQPPAQGSSPATAPAGRSGG